MEKSTSILVGALAGLALASPACPAADTSAQYRQALELLESAPLIDGHNDVPWQYRERVQGRLDALDFTSDTSRLDPPMHTDMARLRAGRVGGQFWSVYVDPVFSGPEAVVIQLEQIDIAKGLIERHPELAWAISADDIEEAFARGQIASLIGLEGGHTLNNSLANLRSYYALGARYLTLTHWQTHDWADAATDQPRHDGLSEFGLQVIDEMNRLGMLIDLSHVSEAVMHDALDRSAAPVIFSHSSARGVTDHPRNVPDEVLDRLPDNGGLVMVTFVPSFINDAARQWDARREGERARLERLFPGQPERVEQGLVEWLEKHPPARASLDDVAAHIDYIRARIGAEHIGLGGDFDGISSTPEGLEDVSTYPALIAELIGRGYADEEINGLIGGNVLRALRQAEAVSARLRAARPSGQARFDDFQDKPD